MVCSVLVEEETWWRTCIQNSWVSQWNLQEQVTQEEPVDCEGSSHPATLFNLVPSQKRRISTETTGTAVFHRNWRTFIQVFIIYVSILFHCLNSYCVPYVLSWCLLILLYQCVITLSNVWVITETRVMKRSFLLHISDPGYHQVSSDVTRSLSWLAAGWWYTVKCLCAFRIDFIFELSLFW